MKITIRQEFFQRMQPWGAQRYFFIAHDPSIRRSSVHPGELVFGVKNTVGFLRVRAVDNVVYVEEIRVAEDRRRQGIATQLYKALYEWADQRGLAVKHGPFTSEGKQAYTALKTRGVVRNPQLRRLMR